MRLGSLVLSLLLLSVALDRATGQTSIRRVMIARVERLADGACVVQGFGPDRVVNGQADAPESYELNLRPEECGSVQIETYRMVKVTEGGIFHVRRGQLIPGGTH